MGEVPEGQREIPLIGEMSAKRTKGSAVSARRANPAEELLSPLGEPIRLMNKTLPYNGCISFPTIAPFIPCKNDKKIL